MPLAKTKQFSPVILSLSLKFLFFLSPSLLFLSPLLFQSLCFEFLKNNNRDGDILVHSSLRFIINSLWESNFLKGKVTIPRDRDRDENLMDK